MALLNDVTLNEIAGSVRTPGYDRNALSTGIVQFGAGAFHRGHQAMGIDDALVRGHTDWGICGVGVLVG